MIDSHIHLDQYDEVESRIERWQRAGIEKVVAISSDLESCYRTLELKEKFPDFILAGVGFHPEKDIPPRADVEEWKSLIQVERERISCIGEIGLPHYQLSFLTDPLTAHVEILKEYIDTACTYKLPVVFHAVHDKAEMVYRVLREEAPRLQAHFHWLKASEEVVHNIIKAGYYVSVTPEVCYRERDQKLASRIPDEQLLIETDGPWPFGGPFSGKGTTPLFLNDIIAYLAEERRTNEDDLRSLFVANAKRLYV